MAMAIFARFNIGDRHVLPVYPFAILFAAAVWEWARTQTGRGRGSHVAGRAECR